LAFITIYVFLSKEKILTKYKNLAQLTRNDPIRNTFKRVNIRGLFQNLSYVSHFQLVYTL